MLTINKALGLFSVFGILVLFAACSVEPGPRIEQAPVSIASKVEAGAPRFTVVIVGEFYDATAYGGTRRIYEITDNKTKITYLSATGLSLDKMQKDEDDAEAIEAATEALETMSSFSD